VLSAECWERRHPRWSLSLALFADGCLLIAVCCLLLTHSSLTMEFHFICGPLCTI
jgi:hypothetical protein